MSITDPIADMFTRIRNSLKESHKVVTIPHSKTKLKIANILLENGYISNVEIVKESLFKSYIKLYLKYDNQRVPVISCIDRISKPSKRIYLKKSKIPKILSGFGVAILSTPKGIMCGKTARIKNVGGEYMGVVW